ncbi:hypothetical protein [Psychrobacter sp. SWN149]|nr:hypothetical protein [Psychrobacter sp. SWN149]
MKSLAFGYLLATMMMLAGCQSFQFVDNPIPVTSAPAKLVAQ